MQAVLGQSRSESLVDQLHKKYDGSKDLKGSVLSPEHIKILKHTRTEFRV